MVAFGAVRSKVKSQVRKLLSLDEFSDGILMADFISHYGRHIGRPLNYHDLGYDNLYTFISAIPDVARIKHSEADSNCMVIVMAGMKNKTSRSPPYSSQRDASLNSKSRIVLDAKVEDLEPDKYGRFSLCFRNDGIMSDDEMRREFGVAGEISDIHRTDRLIFLRYESKDDLQSCYRMFGAKYNFRLGKTKKEPMLNGNGSSENNSDQQQSKNHGQRGQRPLHHSEGPSGDADRHQRGKEWHQGQHGINSIRHNVTDDESSSTELFISNIESQEDFEKAIQMYRPKNFNVVSKGSTRYAFVSMWNPEDAMAAVEELHDTMQQTRRLSVAFNKKKQSNHSDQDSSVSDSCTILERGMPMRKEGTYNRERNHNSGARNKTKIPKENGAVNGMPELESSVDFSSMPPLVPNAEVHDPDGLYDLDTRILVTNFPPQTMESELRDVFQGYRVIDICVLNNGYTNECTSALLYMGTIYEAVKAMTDERGFEMDGYPLKVLVPPGNVLLKRILIRMETGLRDWN